MADIDVQKKSSGPGIWPWLIGLAVLALIVWVIMEMGDDDVDDDTMLYEDTTVVAPQPMPAPAPMPYDTGAAFQDTLPPPGAPGDTL